MLQTWCLSKSHYTLLTDNPHVEAAARQDGLSLMAEYAKSGRLVAVQYAGPEDAVKVVAAQKYPVEKFDISSRLIKGPAPDSKGRRGKCLMRIKHFVPGPKACA